MNQDFYIGQVFDGIYPPEAASWCNGNNATIEEKHREENGVRYYEIVAIPEPPTPTNEEIRKMREKAYITESDPISAHISYLQRKEQTPEIVAEIAQLEAEQEEIRNAIKERFPYYE